MKTYDVVKQQAAGVHGLKEIVRNADSKLSDAEKISRNVVLASVLEPISNKEGCTTRYSDLKPTKTLELFLAAGVNIGAAFYHMVSYIESERDTKGIYKFYYEAQALSKVKRAGGKINQGIIEYLIPVVAAQAAFDPKFEKTPILVLKKSEEVMSNTTSIDVSYLIDAKILANELSNFTKYPVSKHKVKNVLKYYSEEILLERSRNNSKAITFNSQFLDNFEGARVAHEAMMKSSSIGISERAVDGYKAIMSKYAETDIGRGTAADLMAVALYLFISYRKEEPIA